MKREPTLATLRALAAADDAWYGSTEGKPEPGWTDESKAHFRALKAYRVETGAQQRTKADVDAEIVRAVRDDWRRGVGGGLLFDALLRSTLEELCREPYGPTGAAASASPEDIAAPGGAPSDGPGCPHSTPWCESCERAQRLWGSKDQPSNGRAPGGAEARPPSEPTPGPATALEESAPARGGSHPDERPCGCEQTQALQQQLAALRARNDNLANYVHSIRTLAKATDVTLLFQELDREP